MTSCAGATDQEDEIVKNEDYRRFIIWMVERIGDNASLKRIYRLAHYLYIHLGGDNSVSEN